MAEEQREDNPPFSAEQLAWIDRMVEARASALIRKRGYLFPPPVQALPAADPLATATAASIVGEPSVIVAVTGECPT